jgi:hypothetical protein
MRGSIAIASLWLAGAAYGQAITPGTYSNEEQVYFEKEAGRAPPAPLTIAVGADGTTRAIDAYGAPAQMPKVALAARGDLVVATYAGTGSTELRRARPVTCWASLKKDGLKSDGKEDWTFDRDLKLHDQGGRVLVGKGVAGVKPVILRMRNVSWSGSARSANRPSLVLYVHTPDDPERAVSYVWSDPGAARLGVNLRWMQASCTVDGMEKPISN